LLDVFIMELGQARRTRRTDGHTAGM